MCINSKSGYAECPEIRSRLWFPASSAEFSIVQTCSTLLCYAALSETTLPLEAAIPKRDSANFSNGAQAEQLKKRI